MVNISHCPMAPGKCKCLSGNWILPIFSKFHITCLKILGMKKIVIRTREVLLKWVVDDKICTWTVSSSMSELYQSHILSLVAGTQSQYHKSTIYHISTSSASSHTFNTLRPRQNGCHFTDDIFKCIFLNENISIVIKISQYSSIGSDNGLVPSRRQAILVYWWIYASFGLNELILKEICGHCDKIFIMGQTGCCHFENSLCIQWWKFHQHVQ